MDLLFIFSFGFWDEVMMNSWQEKKMPRAQNKHNQAVITLSIKQGWIERLRL